VLGSRLSNQWCMIDETVLWCSMLCLQSSEQGLQTNNLFESLAVKQVQLQQKPKPFSTT
jgi:hypothetical protein